MTEHSIGRRVKAARALAGYDNAAEFAKKVAFPGLAARNIRKVEADERDLDDLEKGAIAKACGLPVAFFDEPFSTMAAAAETRAAGVQPITGVREAAEAAFAADGTVHSVVPVEGFPGVYEVTIDPPVPDDLDFGITVPITKTFRWTPDGDDLAPDVEGQIRELAEAVVALASGDAASALAAARAAAERPRRGTAGGDTGLGHRPGSQGESAR